MQTRKIMAGTVIGAGMTAMVFAGAGAASASTGGYGEPGKNGGDTTTVSVTKTVDVTKTVNAGNDGQSGAAGAGGSVSNTNTVTNLVSGNSFLNGNLSHNRVTILSGNKTTVTLSVFSFNTTNPAP